MLRLFRFQSQVHLGLMRVKNMPMHRFVFMLCVLLLCAFLYRSKVVMSRPLGPASDSAVATAASDSAQDKVLPSIVLFSLYLGEGLKLHYSYFDLTLHSMRWNPTVDFMLLHVVSDEDFAKPADVSTLVSYPIDPPPNFRIKRIAYSRLQQLIKDRLGVHVPVSYAWSYKMAEYKPTFAHLFRELLVNPRSGGGYQWWGYADLDVVWGNISHFAPLFYRGHPIINSGWIAPRGMCTFYINEPWTRVIFQVDPLFVHLLANNTYMNLDENGVSTRPENVVDGGAHALNMLMHIVLNKRKQRAYHGKSANDRLFVEKIDSVNWAGSVRWSRGNLKIVRETEFPAMHEIMFYHRAFDGFNAPPGIPRKEWVEDMLEYGFLLPYFVPLLTRHVCKGTGAGKFHGSSAEELNRYAPYANCLNGK